MNYRILSCVAGGLLALTGCATSATAPRELVEARSAFERARNGPAARVALVDLHNARQSLETAEQQFTRDPEAPATRDYAYIALRRAEIANARANGIVAEEQRSASEAQAQQLQRQQLATAQSQVRNAQGQLQAERQARVGAETQLQVSEQARAQAEREAAAALASLRQMASVREEQRGMVITLSGEVLFATGESTLLPIAQQRLDQVAQALQTQGPRRILIEGHTDSRGNASTNQVLSQARAQAVRSYLMTRGLTGDMVEAVGVGPSRPIADNNTPEGRANNRRVEIIVSPGQNVPTGNGATPIR